MSEREPVIVEPPSAAACDATTSTGEGAAARGEARPGEPIIVGTVGGRPVVAEDRETETSIPAPRGVTARALAVVDRLKGAVAGTSLSLATAMSGAGATCATGRCGQGCGYACGIIGVTAAGGIAVAAIRRRLRGVGDGVE